MGAADCKHSCGQGYHPEYAPHLKPGEVQCRDCGHITPAPEPIPATDCLDYDPHGCGGAVEMRWPLSGTGKSFPRCDVHWGMRVARQEEINARYGHPDSDCGAPADFDPMYAGERWSEEDY